MNEAEKKIEDQIKYSRLQYSKQLKKQVLYFFIGSLIGFFAGYMLRHAQFEQNQRVEDTLPIYGQ